MRPKIVLYNPRAVFWTMPLALVAIGSALDRERFDVVVVDGRLEPDPVARLLDEARDALLVGLSVLTGAPLHDALVVSRALKAAHPRLPIVWGGWHPSLFPEGCLEEPSVDVAVVGQGEDTLREIALRLEGGDSLAGCQGAVYREHGKPRGNPPRALRDLAHFPAHDYGLIQVERYFARKRRRQLDYISSQGCRFRCEFCADPTVYKRGWTGVAPERLADEAGLLSRRYGFEELAFQDETFFTQPARVAAISEAFLSRELRFGWTATMRADQGARLDDAAFELARRSGLSRVMVGVESGSQAMLDWMKKDATIEQVLITAERLASHGLSAIFNFIVGFPDEPHESIAATLQLLKRVRALSPRFDTPVFYYRPYPGTPIADRSRAKGEAGPSTLEEWAEFDYVGQRGPFISPELYRHVERLRFYARHAFGPTPFWRRPLRALARWRCAKDRYEFPVEMGLAEWIRPALRVS